MSILRSSGERQNYIYYYWTSLINNDNDINNDIAIR